MLVLHGRTARQLFANLPGARFVDASGTVEACRLIKSELEVDMIRQAARTTEAGMRAASLR